MSSRPTRPPALRYRTARRTDVDTLADLALRAYRISSIEARSEFYTEHPRFSIRDVRVGELDGELVASLVLYPLKTFVRGTNVNAIGIGSVAVSPEHRRRGIATTRRRGGIGGKHAGLFRLGDQPAAQFLVVHDGHGPNYVTAGAEFDGRLAPAQRLGHGQPASLTAGLVACLSAGRAPGKEHPMRG